MRDRRAAPLIVIATSALLFCAGCVARYVRIDQKGLTCGDAQRLAVEAVRRMGYTISEVRKPLPSLPGVILAARQQGTSMHNMMVSVACTTQGAEVEAKSDEGGLSAVSFPAEFRRSFSAAVADQPPPRPPAERGLDVLLVPERDGGQAQLGVDLSSFGVLPLSLRITNHTARTYAFNAADVVMQTAGGARVSPSAVEDVVKRLSAEAAQTVRRKTVTRVDIAPNATVTGFLLLPFDDYTRARVELVDRANDEAEGFSIEF